MSGNRNVNLLQFAPRFAGRPTGGAELRNYNLARRLAEHMRVTHLGFSPPGSGAAESHSPDGPRLIPVTRNGSYRPLDLVRGAIGSTPFSVLNYTRAEMTAVLRRLLDEERFDIVQLESIHLGGYLQAIRSAGRARPAIVCDWHNIESEILFRYAETTSSLPRRLYARHAGRTLARYECRFIDECELHIAVSERDAEQLRQYSPGIRVVVIENGVDARHFAAGEASPGSRTPHRVVFVGAMDYHANIDAAVFFAREVWPKLAERVPDAVFTIVGRKPSDAVRALAAGERIEVTGTVDDVRPFYREAWVAVAPLRVGGGTRLKILEAMAAGVPVVSTGLGAEGLHAEPNRDYLLADTAGALAEAIASLAGDAAKRTALIRAGRDLVQRQYDWAALGDALASHLLQLASESAKRHRPME